MSEEHKSIILALLLPILDAMVNKEPRDAARYAGKLTFFRDGMLEQLEVIAKGKADARTFGALKRGYEKTAPDVERLIERLTAARDKLAGDPMARQIDAILHSESTGKATLRWEIEQLIHSWECAVELPTGDPLKELSLKNLADDARFICQGIGQLNSEIERLNRMVRGA